MAPLSDGDVSVLDFSDAENGFTAADFLSCPLEEAISEPGRLMLAASPGEDAKLGRLKSDACEACGLTLVLWVVALFAGDSLGSFLAWKLYLGSGCLSSTVSGDSLRWVGL